MTWSSETGTLRGEQWEGSDRVGEIEQNQGEDRIQTARGNLDIVNVRRWFYTATTIQNFIAR